MTDIAEVKEAIKVESYENEHEAFAARYQLSLFLHSSHVIFLPECMSLLPCPHHYEYCDNTPNLRHETM